MDLHAAAKKRWVVFWMQLICKLLQIVIKLINDIIEVLLGFSFCLNNKKLKIAKSWVLLYIFKSIRQCPVIYFPSFYHGSLVSPICGITRIYYRCMPIFALALSSVGCLHFVVDCINLILICDSSVAATWMVWVVSWLYFCLSVFVVQGYKL